MKKIFLLIVLFSSVLSHAQIEDSAVIKIESDKVKVLETFDVEAVVIGVLQGPAKLAVLQVISAEKNNCNLKNGDEILVEFYFGTQIRNIEPTLPGIEAGTKIMGEIFCKDNVNTIQIDYTMMRYIHLSAIPKE